MFICFDSFVCHALKYFPMLKGSEVHSVHCSALHTALQSPPLVSQFILHVAVLVILVTKNHQTLVAIKCISQQFYTAGGSGAGVS